jgi:hypothetical protein
MRTPQSLECDLVSLASDVVDPIFWTRKEAFLR